MKDHSWLPLEFKTIEMINVGGAMTLQSSDGRNDMKNAVAIFKSIQNKDRRAMKVSHNRLWRVYTLVPIQFLYGNNNKTR